MEDPSAWRAARARAWVRLLAVDRAPLKASADYRRLWWAELVSVAGSQITAFAVFFQVTTLTGSAAKVGLVGLIQFVMLAGTTIFAGPLIDRLDRRKILLVTQTALVLTSFALLGGALVDHPPLALVYAAAGASAGLTGIALPTRGAIVPNLIPPQLLSSAIALNQVMWTSAIVVGPAIGGVVIGTAGLEWAYALDVASFTATIYATLRLPAQRPRRDEGEPTMGIAAVREAFTFLRGKRVLQSTFVVDLVAMIFGMPRALFPILAIQQFHRGAEVAGALTSAIGVGALIGAATSGWVGRVRRQGLAVLIAVAAWGACVALFGLSGWLPLAFVLLAAAGAADVISAVFRGTILQATVTDAVRGRLSALHILVVGGGPRLGDLEAGLVAAAFSPTFSVVSGGLACIAGVFVVAAVYPEFARYVEPPPTDGEAIGSN